MAEPCCSIALSTTVPEITLSTTVPEVTLSSSFPSMTLTAGGCVLALSSTPIELSLGTSPVNTTLQSTPLVINLASPFPIGAGEPNTMSNVGAGAAVFRSKTGFNFELRTLTSDSADVEFDQQADEIDLAVRGLSYAANCSASESIGDAVYVSGPKSGGKITVSKVSGLSVDTEFPVLGVVSSKPSPTDCVVRRQGEVELGYGSFSAGDRLFVGSDARATTSLTSTPGEILQAVGVATGPNSMIVGVEPPVGRN